jgi:predicted GIY-YIG superfamily endonuclease
MATINVHLYLLQLADSKYYVGQSDRPDVRLIEHRIGQGSKWTRLHPPIAILNTREIVVDSPKEAILYENWMTLHYMEKFGWENVRGGEYLDLENYRLREKLNHIYDTETNKIKYYIPNTPYLFGPTTYWLIYILELPRSHYYIGSCRRLGKALGKHFVGKNVPLKIKDLIVVKPQDGHYLDIKRNLFRQYIQKYGRDKVAGAQLPGESPD